MHTHACKHKCTHTRTKGMITAKKKNHGHTIGRVQHSTRVSSLQHLEGSGKMHQGMCARDGLVYRCALGRLAKYRRTQKTRRSVSKSLCAICNSPPSIFLRSQAKLLMKHSSHAFVKSLPICIRLHIILLSTTKNCQGEQTTTLAGSWYHPPLRVLSFCHRCP